MRIWDIHPGYLNRQSLLGEHRELHGIVSILANRKTGYSKHPETQRWMKFGWALNRRHKLLACEMELRGCIDKSPVYTRSNPGYWPSTYIDQPYRQFVLLGDKYAKKEMGRISLPKNISELWAHHKYSVLARDQSLYRQLGRDVAIAKMQFLDLAVVLTEMLRRPPSRGGISNAVQHMWGHVATENSRMGAAWSLRRLLRETQKRAMTTNNTYLIASIALSELAAWLPG